MQSILDFIFFFQRVGHVLLLSCSDDNTLSLPEIFNNYFNNISVSWIEALLCSVSIIVWIYAIDRIKKDLFYCSPLHVIVLILMTIGGFASFLNTIIFVCLILFLQWSFKFYFQSIGIDKNSLEKRRSVIHDDIVLRFKQFKSIYYLCPEKYTLSNGYAKRHNSPNNFYITFKYVDFIKYQLWKTQIENKKIVKKTNNTDKLEQYLNIIQEDIKVNEKLAEQYANKAQALLKNIKL